MLRLPQSLKAAATADGKAVAREGAADFVLPLGTKLADVEFGM